MDRQAVFEAWAPRDALWSPWAKPVLFAHIDATVKGLLPPRPAWVREELLQIRQAHAGYRTNAQTAKPALLLDLPGVEGIAAGLAVADLGYRPVPLYTALPSPAAIVPMDEVLRAIVGGASELPGKALAPSAPPAFLLDDRRAGKGQSARPGQFDNRSVAFTSDFPSAANLTSAGIDAVVLVHRDGLVPSSDLVPTLAAWQAGGLTILVVCADVPSAPETIRVRSPGALARAALWWKRSFLRRGPEGGFGAWTQQGG